MARGQGFGQAGGAVMHRAAVIHNSYTVLGRQEIKRPWKVQITHARLAVLGRARIDLCCDFGRRRFGTSSVLGGGGASSAGAGLRGAAAGKRGIRGRASVLRSVWWTEGTDRNHRT